MAKTCSSKLNEQLKQTNFMTISSELPSESFDEYLHFGPPVFVFQRKNNHAIQELITLLQKKQDLFQH